MVNFDNESTVSTPPGDVVKIVVLERREQVIEALENYFQIEGLNMDAQHKLNVLRSRVMAFWFQVQAMVKRRLKNARGTVEDPTYEMVEEAIRNAKDEKKLIDAYEWLNEFADDMGLTYIDSRPRHDRTIVEAANQAKNV